MVQMGGDEGLAVGTCVIECQSEHLLHNRELTDAAIARITPEGLSGAEEAVTRWQRPPRPPAPVRPHCCAPRSS